MNNFISMCCINKSVNIFIYFSKFYPLQISQVTTQVKFDYPMTDRPISVFILFRNISKQKLEDDGRGKQITIGHNYSYLPQT